MNPTNEPSNFSLPLFWQSPKIPIIPPCTSQPFPNPFTTQNELQRPRAVNSFRNSYLLTIPSPFKNWEHLRVKLNGQFANNKTIIMPENWHRWWESGHKNGFDSDILASTGCSSWSSAKMFEDTRISRSIYAVRRKFNYPVSCSQQWANISL